MDHIQNSTSESISAQLKADVLPIFSSLPSIYSFHSRYVKRGALHSAQPLYGFAIVRDRARTLGTLQRFVETTK